LVYRLSFLLGQWDNSADKLNQKSSYPPLAIESVSAGTLARDWDSVQSSGALVSAAVGITAAEEAAIISAV